jgi:hypothetical protein
MEGGGCMELHDWVELVAVIVTGIGTLLAVWVALWLQHWKVNKRRPSLKLGFDESDECEDFSFVRLKGYESLWLRFRVRNEADRDTADDVQVLLTRVRGSPDPHLAGRFPTRPLKWSDMEVGTLDLPAGIERHVDVAHFRRRGSDSKPSLRVVVFPSGSDDPEDPPAERRHTLETGRYEFELAVAARGVDATYYHAVIDFPSDCGTDPEDIRHSVKVQLHPGRLSSAASESPAEAVDQSHEEEDT